MSITVRCYSKIADTEPAMLPDGKPAVFTGDDYQAISEPPAPSQNATKSTFHRVVLNPNSADPTKSLQVHVRSGERDSTDPLRFERVEVWVEVPDAVRTEANEPLDVQLRWYGDCEGNATRLIQSEAEEADAEKSLETLIADGADDDAIIAAVAALDYKSLGDELTRLRVAPLPQKSVERRTALVEAAIKEKDANVQH